MDRWDALVLMGLALIGGGLGLHWPWLALVVDGVLLLLIGLAGAFSAEREALLEKLLARKQGRG